LMNLQWMTAPLEPVPLNKRKAPLEQSSGAIFMF
jgi:hypothetical protein